MGVMIPIMPPFAWALGVDDPAQMAIFVLTAAAVLDGAIFGDHCSPIWIQPSSPHSRPVATICTTTQLPYAVTTMVIASICGYTLIAFTGFTSLIYFALFPIAAWTVLRLIGRKVETVS